MLDGLKIIELCFKDLQKNGYDVKNNELKNMSIEHYGKYLENCTLKELESFLLCAPNNYSSSELARINHIEITVEVKYTGNTGSF